MALHIQPIYEEFAAEVGGIDLSKPLEKEEWTQIDEAFLKYGVLVFPGQKLEADQHLTFAKTFGPLEDSVGYFIPKDAKLRIDQRLSDISNMTLDGQIWGKDSLERTFHLANKLWHTDSTFHKVPARISMLYGLSVAPVGGQTEYADMRAAYDALPDDLKKRVENLVAEHSILHSRDAAGFEAPPAELRKLFPSVPQVLVRHNERSGRNALYLASHAGSILGMPQDEGKALLKELTAHAPQRQFCYLHRWRPNDLVMWDNRCTMHRARSYDDLAHPRDLRRATVSDEIPSCERQGVAVPEAVAA